MKTSTRPAIDRTNGYPLSTVPTPTYCFGLFVQTNSAGDQWAANFFFRTTSDAKRHAKHFGSFAVGRVVSA